MREVTRQACEAKISVRTCSGPYSLTIPFPELENHVNTGQNRNC